MNVKSESPNIRRKQKLIKFTKRDIAQNQFPARERIPPMFWNQGREPRYEERRCTACGNDFVAAKRLVRKTCSKDCRMKKLQMAAALARAV